MLVLSRKEAERIRLGEDIVITVVRIGGDKVRLGIEAPKDMLVLRDELQPFDKEGTPGLANPAGLASPMMANTATLAKAVVEIDAGSAPLQAAG